MHTRKTDEGTANVCGYETDTFNLHTSQTKVTEKNVSRGSSVGAVTDYGLDGRGSISDRGTGFFL
jgi:hypothetical protein